MREGKLLQVSGSDRRKMKRFIASQLPDGVGQFVLASGCDGSIGVHVAVEGDDLVIESDVPEAVSLSDVYAHYRWAMMPASEQWQEIAIVHPLRSVVGQSVPKLEARSCGVPGAVRERRKPRMVPEKESPLRIADVAERLGCSYSAARDRMLSGRIKSFRDGALIRTTEQCLQAFLHERTTANQKSVDPSASSVRRKAVSSRFEKGGVADRFLRKRRPG